MTAKVLSRGPRFYRLQAWAVHLYTSMGLVVGLLAMAAILAGNAHRSVALLGLAMLVDATDGTLARTCDVKRWTPRFDGRKLDDIIDYLNYTFIPVIFAYRFGLVAGLGGQIVLSIVLILSAYGFCQTAAKTDDGYFTGFPNFWNIVILYLYLLNLEPTINAFILLLFAILVLAPVRYVTHHTVPFHRLTLVMMGLFWVALIALGATMDHAPPWLIWLSLVAPAYYVGMSAYLQFASRK
jgi:phosphatidylcholine synthase